MQEDVARSVLLQGFSVRYDVVELSDGSGAVGGDGIVERDIPLFKGALCMAFSEAGFLCDELGECHFSK